MRHRRFLTSILICHRGKCLLTSFPKFNKMPIPSILLSESWVCHHAFENHACSAEIFKVVYFYLFSTRKKSSHESINYSLETFLFLPWWAPLPCLQIKGSLIIQIGMDCWMFLQIWITRKTRWKLGRNLLWVNDWVYVCDWREGKVEGGKLCFVDSATEPKIGH